MKEKRTLCLKKTTIARLDSLSKDEKNLVVGGSKCCATCHCAPGDEVDTLAQVN